MNLSDKNTSVVWLLKIGVAFAFIYPGIAGLITPTDWVGFVPVWIEQIISLEIFLTIFSIFEIILGISILVMPRPFYPALLAGFILLSIVLSTLGVFNVTFRDIPIFFMTIALAVLSKKY